MTGERKDNDWQIGKKSHWSLPSEIMNLATLIHGIPHKEVSDDRQDEIG